MLHPSQLFAQIPIEMAIWWRILHFCTTWYVYIYGFENRLPLLNLLVDHHFPYERPGIDHKFDGIPKEYLHVAMNPILLDVHFLKNENKVAPINGLMTIP